MPSQAPMLSPDRRRFLWEGGGGAAGIALAAWMGEFALPGRLAQGGTTESVAATSLSSAKPPHFSPQAKRVIWLFMHGGPSHVDLFDLL